MPDSFGVGFSLTAKHALNRLNTVFFPQNELKNGF